MPVCAVCAVGVAAGAGLSRWLKIDDLISGIWIGAFLLFLSIWSVNIIFRKKERRKILFYAISVLVWWLISFIPLYFIGFFDSQCPKILGVERLLCGSLIGLILTLISFWFENMIRKRNNNKARFPYQKVIIPLSFLLVFSFLIWLII